MKHDTANSAPGSTKGKYEGVSRTRTRSPNRRRPISSSVPFRVARAGPGCTARPFRGGEGGGGGGVGAAGREAAAGQVVFRGGAGLGMARVWARRGWVRSRAPPSGEKVSWVSPAGGSGGD